jgi:dolichol-phosphate mannosyltransferase
VKNLTEKYKNLFLLTGQKKGLGAAYIRGMKYAMENLKGEAVIEMDADFQHDPKDVKRLVTKLDGGYDYVLGSRFIEGGSIPKEWGVHRKFLSVVGNLFARTILGLSEIHDLTTGFKLSRVSLLKKIDLDRVISKSYAYKIHLLYEMVKLGAKVKEVPIDFQSREHGSSKMEGEDFFESLRVVFTIRLRDFLKK